VTHYDDAAKTALQMGHRDTDLLFRHYRGLATREDAAAYGALVAALEDPAASVRRAAIDALFSIAATTRGFEPKDPPEKRAEALVRWRTWLEEQKK
jgi:HEAT repeat protein